MRADLRLAGYYDENEYAQQAADSRWRQASRLIKKQITAGDQLSRKRSLAVIFIVGATVKALSTLGYLQLSMLAKPNCDRKLFQTIKRQKIQSIVEIGLADGQRCQQMLRVATKFSDRPLRYTGIDLFDAREDDQRLKLIDMHRRLKEADAKTQLVPGTAGIAIQRIANSHLRTDMILVSGEISRTEVELALPFFPRMLHTNSVVLLQPQVDEKYRVMNRLDIQRWLTKIGQSAQDDQPAARAA